MRFLPRVKFQRKTKLSAFIKDHEFDEQWYLEHYKDIAEAVNYGVWQSGAEHYFHKGRSENRFPNLAQLNEIHFDERFYLHQYQDVAKEVTRGAFQSGLDHYLMNGRSEGRRPNAEKLDDVEDIADGESPIEVIFERHAGASYLAPSDLSVSGQKPRRILVVGSCSAEAWGLHISHSTHKEGDFVLSNNASQLPEEPPRDVAEYDFQVVQIAFRSVLWDCDLHFIPYADEDAHHRVFEEVCDRLSLQLSLFLKWNIKHGLLTFVSNFLVPQQDLTGRLLPRYDLRNTIYFAEQLNRRLEGMLKDYKNVYLLDIDKISTSLGRRYIQDDTVYHSNHNGLLPHTINTATRLEAVAQLSSYYRITWNEDFIRAIWQEVLAMFRTTHQFDTVKLVVLDLDDTLWNGVSGEIDDLGFHMIEGWPLGILEALGYLKKRGLLLAIISKNDGERIRAIWDTIFCGRARLSDFCSIKINWLPKAENMRAILKEVNLLPRNTIFIDDNPVERAAMRHDFPDIRVLGKHPFYLRRILLWAPETQVAFVSDESNRRTEMVHAQIQREDQRKQLSREEFLTSLRPKVKMIEISNLNHPKFPRSFELINKTNQFNTTGRRWSLDECAAAFENRTMFHAFEVEDRFTHYGLVGVAIVHGAEIKQFVMSCRVVGIDVESAVLIHLLRRLEDNGSVTAAFTKTDANLLCRDFFEKAGFLESVDHSWVLDGTPFLLKPPPHVEITA